ncbi:MAG: dihydroorotate dehydrogenase electron transfer subunit [Dehalococcoidia bacterium]|nr:dihydroorotate dehydrogenase electron transfer subunit [Dehalococcoidia bacterium]
MSARVLSCESLSAQLSMLVLEAPEIAGAAVPGQFVMVQCDGHALRRPLGVHAAGNGKVALLIRVKGEGTQWLSRRSAGQMLNMNGPLGRPFTAPETRSHLLLVGGGVGIAPLCFLAAEVAEKHDVVLVQGAVTSAELYRAPAGLQSLIPSMTRLDSVTSVTATDDGTEGFAGTAFDASLNYLEWADVVYLCGPTAMCSAVNTLACEQLSCATPMHNAILDVETAAQKLLSAQVSLEVRMGCGVGACYCCSVPTVAGRKKVCADGPVFGLSDILWGDI